MVLLPGNIQSPKSTTYNTGLFDLVVEHRASKTYMRMKVHGANITTGKISATMRVLRELCPRVLATKCFNENNFSFAKEVQDTEIGHLFEHLLLEYLCQVKASSDVEGAIHRGETWWDWTRESRGVFHIEVNVGWVDLRYFAQALHQAMHVTSCVLKD